ncbi:MAG: hypothetical protein KF833_14380 [Verrucomicrobiae bacterium]|nr:hypothetical protein [Verrucomicrobiae bacterium]
MKRVRVWIYLLAAGAALVSARAETAPTAGQVIERYIEAAGGRDALERLRSRVMRGQIEVTALGATGAFEIRSKAPDRQVSKIEFPVFGTLREGYDGTVAWAVVPLQGLRVKEKEELARVQRSTGFPRELSLGKAYRRLEVKGAVDVGGKPAWLLEGHPAEGKPDRLYFDRATGLLVREETTVKTLVGEMTFQVDLGDYRVVDGVQVPFSMRMPRPADVGFRIAIEEVHHNVPMEESEFAKPAR